jgi:hypothetical protein
MRKLGKNIFGKGFDLKAEVTNGQCPLCDKKTIFVSLYQNFYRCMTCGGDTEQKVNGVISYMPATMSEFGPTSVMELQPDEPKA